MDGGYGLVGKGFGCSDGRGFVLEWCVIAGQGDGIFGFVVQCKYSYIRNDLVRSPSGERDGRRRRRPTSNGVT